MGYESRDNPTLSLISKGPAVVDSRGRALQEGDEIVLRPGIQIFFRVARITPVMEPGAPRGLYRVDLVGMPAFITKAGEQNQEFTRVQTAAEVGPLPFGKQAEEKAEGED